MGWFKVDDQLAFHAKTVMAGNSAMGLWVRAGAWASAQLTDGKVPKHMANAMANNGEPDALVMSGLWIDEGDEYRFHDWDVFQPSAAEEKSRREDISRKRSEAGKLGAKAKWEREKADGKHGKPDDNAVAPLWQADSKPMAPSRPVPSFEKTCAPATPQRETAKGATAAEFDAWYGEYPRKRGKEAARKAFTKARRRASMEDLMDGLRQFNAATKHKERDFLPYPATWLNAGQWEDDYSTPPEQEDYAWKIS